MKQIKKLSLSNLISKLTRNEMRYVIAGSGSNGVNDCCIAYGSGVTPLWSCGYDYKTAQDHYNNGGRGYCCESC